MFINDISISNYIYIYITLYSQLGRLVPQGHLVMSGDIHGTINKGGDKLLWTRSWWRQEHCSASSNAQSKNYPAQNVNSDSAESIWYLPHPHIHTHTPHTTPHTTHTHTHHTHTHTHTTHTTPHTHTHTYTPHIPYIHTHTVHTQRDTQELYIW
jgi:hypothetical protein